MTKFIQNFIDGHWEARAETPEELAARFVRMIDAFEQIDPIFHRWACSYRRPRNFETFATFSPRRSPQTCRRTAPGESPSSIRL